MFVDIRDFTPFARPTPRGHRRAPNALFEIVVPAVVDAGGHVNKFLGDGALRSLRPQQPRRSRRRRCDRAVLIHRHVAQRFSGELRIGIASHRCGVAGTIGAQASSSLL